MFYMPSRFSLNRPLQSAGDQRTGIVQKYVDFFFSFSVSFSFPFNRTVHQLGDFDTIFITDFKT